MVDGRAWLSVVVALTVSACGGGGSTPTTPSPAPQSPAPAAAVMTVMVGATGVSPTQIRIDVNQVVRFTNNGTRTVEIRSDPHPTHEFCPPVNQVGVLAPGQSRDTASFTRAGTCTYHNHLDADTPGFRGSIVVGNVSDPGPSPTPVPY